MLRLLPLFLALALLLAGCGGSGGASDVSPTSNTGSINGPDSIHENSSNQYSIQRSSNAISSCQWSVVPATAGTFTASTSPSTSFNTGSVSSDTEAEIQVLVTPETGTASVSKLKIVIKDSQPDGSQPVANAQAEPTSIHPGDSVQITNFSHDPDGIDTIVKWEWDFSWVADDGFIVDSTDKEPVIEFTEIGIHKVHLRVTDDSGMTDMLDEPLSIEVTEGYLAPVAKATLSTLVSNMCASVMFEDNGSYAQSGDSIILYEWDWENDGVFDQSGTSVSHTWNTPGIANVQMRVTDSNNVSSTLSCPLAIEIRNTGPTARINSMANTVVEDNIIAFSATDSFDIDCDDFIAEYAWDWECDGNYDYFGPAINHVFSTPGTQYIQLRVTDLHGGTGFLLAPFTIDVLPRLTSSWGGSGNDIAFDLAIDSYGNTYITGSFSHTIDFDPDDPVYEVTSVNATDAFLSKFDPNGEFLWVTTWGTDTINAGNGVVVPMSDFIYVTGTSGLMKFDQSGNILWTVDTGKTGEGVAVDDFSAVYHSGHFIPDGQTQSDLFISSVSFDGAVNWELTIGSGDCDMAYDIGVDSTGNVYTVGHFQGSVDFNPFGVTDFFSTTDPQVTESFLTSYTSDGNYNWTSTWACRESYGMHITAAEDIYITGMYNGDTPVNTSSGDIMLEGGLGSFLAYFNTLGECVWIQGWSEYVAPPPPPPPNNNGYDPGYGVTTDSSGNIYVVGSFSPPVDFNPGMGEDIPPSGGAYIVKYDSVGSYNGVITWGAHYDTGWDNAFGVAADPSGNLYVTGDYGGTSDFGLEYEDGHTSNGLNDAYLMKIPWGSIW